MSLHLRLGLAASAMLSVFAALLILGINTALERHTWAMLEALLKGRMDFLLATTSVDDRGRVQVHHSLLKTRLRLPGSGEYARIFDQKGQLLWRSPSVLGLALPLPPPLRPGQFHYWRDPTGGTALVALSLGIGWNTPAARFPLVFNVAVDASDFYARSRRIQHMATFMIATTVVVALAALLAVLYWGLRPLRKVDQALQALEAGRIKAIPEDQPHEISRLVGRINSLLRQERKLQHRYRDSLENLAHSLKTPLALLRGSLPARRREDDRKQAEYLEHLDRMDQIITHQLQRAGTMGPSTANVQTRLAPILDKLLAALGKVYRDKGVACEQRIADDATFPMDPSDFMELAGNLLDNAFKYCRRRVAVELAGNDREAVLIVEDDGPGIPVGAREAVLERGKRLGSKMEGSGIGLAMVHDIVEIYGGRLEIQDTPLGGTALVVFIPRRPR